MSPIRDPLIDETIGTARNTVIVNEDNITVVSVGVQGPSAPEVTAEEPLQLINNNTVMRVAPGTVNGQGLIWNGSAWVQTAVVPAGSDGTVPFKASGAFSGDGTRFRYDTANAVLSVPFLNNAVIDGGNF